MSCQLPEGKDGDQVIYNIWERSDSAETFYTCMDVTVMGTGAGNGNGGGQGGGSDTGNGDDNTDNTGGNDDGHNGDDNNDGNSGSSQCAANAFTSGLNYNAGDIVNNAGGTYECVIGGWCTSEADWAYEPGEGMFWTQAWKTAEVCDDVAVDGTDGPGGNESGSGNGDPGDSTAGNGSDEADCDAPSFVSGSQYSSGDVVANAGDSYECIIGGWCSSAADWAYAPGVGLYWTQAWALADSCGGSIGGGSSNSDSSGDSNGDDTDSGDDRSDNESDNGSGDDSNGNSGSDGSDTDDSGTDDSNDSGDDGADDSGDDNSDTDTGNKWRR